MADRTGLEPATSGVTGRHSNQLNYRSATVVFACPMTVTHCAAKTFLVGGAGIEPATLAL